MFKGCFPFRNLVSLVGHSSLLRFSARFWRPFFFAFSTERFIEPLHSFTADFALERIRVFIHALKNALVQGKCSRIVDNRVARLNGPAQLVKFIACMVMIAQQDAFGLFGTGCGSEAALSAGRKCAEFSCATLNADCDGHGLGSSLSTKV
jgi:hypothetical protein